jgi:hypothetical protein
MIWLLPHPHTENERQLADGRRGRKVGEEPNHPLKIIHHSLDPAKGIKNGTSIKKLPLSGCVAVVEMGSVLSRNC